MIRHTPANFPLATYKHLERAIELVKGPLRPPQGVEGGWVVVVVVGGV